MRGEKSAVNAQPDFGITYCRVGIVPCKRMEFCPAQPCTMSVIAFVTRALAIRSQAFR